MARIKKGIILAGGTGSRLYPLTIASNKQLLPIYDKPVIYYPLTILMLAGVQDILIISTPEDLPAIKQLFGAGENIGVRFSYKEQKKPTGLPDAFVLGEDFINNDPVMMILGDNFFHGYGVSEAVYGPAQDIKGAHIFTYAVEDPSRYGVVNLDQNSVVKSIEEKPKNPHSNLAVSGLYYFDGTVCERAKALKPSARGEKEIVDLINSYLQEEVLTMSQLGRGCVWFDVGTPKSLLDASNYVEVIQSRQGTFIASPEEVAWRMGFISQAKLARYVESLPQGAYKFYLERILKQ